MYARPAGASSDGVLHIVSCFIDIDSIWAHVVGNSLAVWESKSLFMQPYWCLLRSPRSVYLWARGGRYLFQGAMEESCKARSQPLIPDHDGHRTSRGRSNCDSGPTSSCMQVALKFIDKNCKRFVIDFQISFEYSSKWNCLCS